MWRIERRLKHGEFIEGIKSNNFAVKRNRVSLSGCGSASFGILLGILCFLVRVVPHVGAVNENLLILPKTTDRHILNRNGSVTVGFSLTVLAPRVTITLLPPIILRGPSRKSSGTESQAELIAFYRDFLVDYMDFMDWSTAQLVFPTAQPELCDYFRTTLLRSVGVHATCVSNYSEKQVYLQDNPPGPQNIIALRFFPSNPNESRRVTVHPKFLINYSSARQILVLAGHEKMERIIDQLQPEVNTNYKWTLASPSPLNRSMMSIHDVYGFATSPNPIANPIGLWSLSTGIIIDQDKSLGPGDLNQRLFRITTVQGQPFIYLDSTPDGLSGHGYLLDILDTISSQLNFKYELLTPLDNKFGAVDEYGNWSGMVGMLQRKEAEMALMSFSLTATRKTVMDFSPPVEYSSTRLLIRRDWQNAEIKWNAFLRPFHYGVWMAIPLTICLGVVTLLTFSRFQLMKTTPGNSAWILSTCFLLQGQTEHSSIRIFPYRIALGTFWILALVTYASYTARLTSFLAATTENMPIHSLSEAVYNRNWKIGLVRGSSFLDRVKESGLVEMRGLWKRIQDDSSGLVGGFQEGVQRVYQERFIFFTSDLIPTFMIKGNCSYTWLPGNYFPGFGYMGYQKNFPFAKIISQRVAKLRETGQMKRLFRKWWGTEFSCSSNTGDSFVGMSLYETGTAFLILFLGLSLAITFMIGELYFRPSHNQSRNSPLHSSSTISQDQQQHPTSIGFPAKLNAQEDGYQNYGNLTFKSTPFQYNNLEHPSLELNESLRNKLNHNGFLAL